MDTNFISNKRAVLSEMQRAKAACLEALGMEFTHHAVTNIHSRGHVVTGDMSRAQTYQVDLQDGEVMVGNSMPYAVHVELPGITRNWAGGHFMRDALNDNQQSYEKVIEAILGESFK